MKIKTLGLTFFLVILSQTSNSTELKSDGFEAEMNKRLSANVRQLKIGFSTETIWGGRSRNVRKEFLDSVVTPTPLKFAPTGKKDNIFSEQFDYAIGEESRPLSPSLLADALFKDSKVTQLFIKSMSSLKPLSELLANQDITNLVYLGLIHESLKSNSTNLRALVILNLFREPKPLKDSLEDYLVQDIPRVFVSHRRDKELGTYLNILLAYAKLSKNGILNLHVRAKGLEGNLRLGHFKICKQAGDEFIKQIDLSSVQSSDPLVLGGLAVISACHRLVFDFSSAEKIMANFKATKPEFNPTNSFAWMEVAKIERDKGDHKKFADIVNSVYQSDPERHRSVIVSLQQYEAMVYSQNVATESFEKKVMSLAATDPSTLFFFHIMQALRLEMADDFKSVIKSLDSAEKAGYSGASADASFVDTLLLQIQALARAGLTDKALILSKSAREAIQNFDSGKEERLSILDFWKNYKPNEKVDISKIPSNIPKRHPLVMTIHGLSERQKGLSR